MKKRIVAVSLVLLSLLVVAACDPAPAATPPEEGAPAASFSSEIDYQVVNALLDNSGNPVQLDAYVRDPDIDRAIPFLNGLGYGETGEVPAPGDGGVVVTQTGSSDPLCTGSCPYTMATSSVAEGEGETRILIALNGGAIELWADADEPGSSLSALPAADPGAELVIALAIGSEYRLAVEGQPGCAADVVGDDEVSTFEMTGPNADVSIHAADDADCSGEPVGDPVGVTPTNGSRTLLLLMPQAGDDSRAQAIDIDL